MPPLPRFAVGAPVAALHLPALPEPPPAAGVVVERGATGLLAIRLLGARVPGAFAVDFGSSEFARRLAEGKRGLLGRAIGLARGDRPLVWDTTAGFGRDAARLAILGARVVAFERDPVVHALLEDGLSRARQGDDPLATALRERLELRLEDARAALATLPTLPRERAPEVLFLDPMFPERGAALARKEAQLLQALLGEGDPAEDAALFAAARAAHPRRIVVKRPRHAPPIAPAPAADHRFEGKSVRYDLYL